jgi:large subunit ribosomal protein L24
MQTENKPAKRHIKTGDLVKVIAGDDKGKTGRVVRIITDKDRAIVEDLNIVKRHIKPSAKNPDGGIIEKEAPIHISNLMLVEASTNQPTRTGRKLNSNGKLQRFSKNSGKFID